MASNTFNVKTFKEMINLREKFAQNRHNEKLGVIDHQLGASIKLAGTKHGQKKEVLDIQDDMNAKQHQRKMEQIQAISRSRNR